MIEAQSIAPVVQEQPYGCALIPRPFTEARAVRIGEWFNRYPMPTMNIAADGCDEQVVPLVEQPDADLWGVELMHAEGDPSLASYYWGNYAGYLYFAYSNKDTADKLAEFYLLRQELEL